MPDLVVVANGLQRIDGLVGPSGPIVPADGATAAATGTAERLAPLAAAGARILWLDTPPPFPSLSGCATPHALEPAIERCTLDGTTLDARADAFAAAAASLPATTYVDARAWLCQDDTMLCPATIDGMLVTADGSHLSWMASRALGPLVGDVARDALE